MVRRIVTRGTGARIVPWLVLALGLTTTVVLYDSIGRALSRRNRESFVKARANLTAEMKAIVQRQTATLYAFAGAIKADPGMTQNRFSLFYSTLKPGISATLPDLIGFSRTATWENRANLVSEAERRLIPNFQMPLTEPRDQVDPVMLFESLETGVTLSPGEDVGRGSARRRAMRTAKARNAPTMSDPIALNSSGAVDSTLIYLPVAHPLNGAFYGYVFIGLKTQELFSPLFPLEAMSSEENPLRKGIRLTLWAGPANAQRIVYANEAMGKPTSMRYRGSIRLDSVDETLNAEFVATEEFGTKPTIQNWILPAGLAISVMLFLLAQSLRVSYEVSDRRAKEQGLLSEVGRLTASETEEESTLKAIAESLSEAFDALCRIDILEADGSLRTISPRGSSFPEAQQLESEYPRLQHDPLLRAAIQTGRTQCVDRFETADGPLREKVAALSLGSVMVVPMRVRDRFVGAVTLIRRNHQRAFPDDVIATTEAVAARLALAIENTRLYRAAQAEVVERRVAEEEVRRLNEGLEDIVAERTRDLKASNHELESFCYSVSHDLRTPLRSLDGFGRALKEDYGSQLDEQAHDYIDRIRASTKRMDELITALLTLSRLTRREIVPAENDASAMVREAMVELDPDQKVIFEVDERLSVYADPRMLMIVLENLLGNAVKFTARVEQPTVKVGRSEDGSLFVRDNGAGFDPAYGSKLFMPFERLHSVREFPGHGIGLATVERIVRRHDGWVRAEGRPGEGATFYVGFPDRE